MKIEDIVNTIINGDALTILKEMPSESINCVITSPPYYGLRNYGVDGQIGLEKTFEEFLKTILDITKEIKRVLKPTGQFWLNLGDCYGGTPTGNTKESSEEYAKNKGDGLYLRKGKQCEGAKSFIPATDNKRMFSGKDNNSRLKQTAGEKCLLMMPERIAINMIDNQGWILRNKIKWAKQVYLFKDKITKGSVMPTSVRDRFNESGEELYFFVKQKKYYSDLDAVRLPPQSELNFERPRMGQGNQTIYEQKRAAGIVRQQDYFGSKYNKFNYRGKFKGSGNVEMFNSPRARMQRKGYNKGSEFEEKYGEPWDRFGGHTKKSKNLEARMEDTKNKDTKSSRAANIKKLLSGVRLGIRPNTGMEKYTNAEWKSNYSKGMRYGGELSEKYKDCEVKGNILGKNIPTVWLIGSEPHNFQKETGVETDHFASFPQALVEIPIKFGCPKDGIVLDCFMGAGTTAMVAKKLGRNYIGIELNKKYIEITEKRLKQIQDNLFNV